MNEFSTQRYSSDEVNRIMRRALKLENEDMISYPDLVDTAREIGLDPQIIEAAIEQEQRDFENKKIRMASLKRRKVGFYSHLWSYLIVNAALLLINNFTPGPWWFQWSLLGWGIGLAFHFKAAFFPGNNSLRRARKPKRGCTRFMTCG
ncbi:hypothetical protein D1AOALGA4SA_10140 [Olavius algarvensis Delta 1 endosymbiont]|nr:hypothetical protein D1AOALGA4SA_10140 [Olavius algarvensis Delta 1 endosymbiont]